MTPTSTNLHFHGLTIPPTCHQDEVLTTSIQPGDPPFEYRFRIPTNEPPGMYWYHPHIHGFSETEVLGGASGALIVQGIERADSAVAGLPEQVLIIRDRDLLNPNAPPDKSEPVVPKLFFDRDGDAANTGTGFGEPAKDLSINFVPVPYPGYQPAVIEMKPGERQLWRVLNASAITYLNFRFVSSCTTASWLGGARRRAIEPERGAEGLCRLADPLGSTARSACGIHRERAAIGRCWTFGDEDSGHRTGW